MTLLPSKFTKHKDIYVFSIKIHRNRLLGIVSILSNVDVEGESDSYEMKENSLLAVTL